MFVSSDCFPQTIDVLKTRSAPLGIELVIDNSDTIKLDDQFFGAILQYPNTEGKIIDYSAWTKKAKEKGIQVAVGSDLMALTMLTPPGEWGADVVFGNSQRFGVPLGFGGPHAAFFAAKDIYKREMPGRIIGVSVDAQGNRALRMALQTREQHIRRDKATSNICTAQVLLAVMASMYAVYHGPDGIKNIAGKIHSNTSRLAESAIKLGYTLVHKNFFDTIVLNAGSDLEKVRSNALASKINFHYINKEQFSISLGEATDEEELQSIFSVLAKAKNSSEKLVTASTTHIPTDLKRKSSFLTHPVGRSRPI